MHLAGKTALVTGGATGNAGYAIALVTAEGCRVAIAGRREEPLRKAAAQATGDNPSGHARRRRGRSGQRSDAPPMGRGHSWHVDILINNAGINSRTHDGRHAAGDWDA